MKKVLIIALCLVGGLQLQAQQGVDRKGLSFGASFGAGVLHFTSGYSGDQTSGDISLPNLKAGWMFNQNLGAFLNAPGQLYSEGGKDRSFEGLIPSVQYWPTNRLWVSAGFGMAMDFPAFYQVKKVKDEKWNLGKGALVSLGFEVLQRPNWTIDIQSKALMSSFKLDEGGRKAGANFTLGVGFNFY